MNYGALLFNDKIPFVMELDGEVNGIKFEVRGKGFGEASTGKVEGSFVCTTGELPVPWSSILTSTTYGYACYVNYPNTIKDFFKSAMPEGYIEERTISFDNDGTYKTRAEVTFENGSVYRKVKLNGEGFKKDGNILGKKLVYTYNPHCVYVYGNHAINGVDSRFNIVHDVVGGGRQIAAHSQRYTPIGSAPVLIPDYHHWQYHTVITKDPTEKRDHMNLVEYIRAVDPKVAYL